MDNLENTQVKSESYRIAAASSDGLVVNQHFGRADSFYIYEIDKTGAYRLLETRKVTPVCNGGNHSDSQLQSNINELKDCRYIVVSRIGMGAANRMEQSGIIPIELPGMIEESINRLTAYEQVRNLF